MNITEARQLNRATITGRIMRRRIMGKKLIFLTVQDDISEIQIALHSSKINVAAYESDTSIWNIVEATGDIHPIQVGEMTLWAEQFRVLAPCVIPAPDTYHELDVETRYRKKYLDFILNKNSRDVIRQRSQIVHNIRTFLHDRGFIEVETPVLQHVYGGATARPFITYFNEMGSEEFLRIATEIFLKKMIVGGFERIYEIGKVFRNEGIDSTHNPEFTSLELYQAHTDLSGMKDLAQSLIMNLSGGKYSNFKEYDQPQSIDEFYFVTRFPISESPLCKARIDNPDFADRFELYYDDMEIANAYNELTDPTEQKNRLKGDNTDDDFIEALSFGMPPCGGIGIGIDRLVMVLTGRKSIKDVIAFPFTRK